MYIIYTYVYLHVSTFVNTHIHTKLYTKLHFYSRTYKHVHIYVHILHLYRCHAIGKHGNMTPGVQTLASCLHTPYSFSRSSIYTCTSITHTY